MNNKLNVSNQNIKKVKIIWVHIYVRNILVENLKR